jgi:hypothetical protein
LNLIKLTAQKQTVTSTVMDNGSSAAKNFMTGNVNGLIDDAKNTIDAAMSGNMSADVTPNDASSFSESGTQQNQVHQIGSETEPTVSIAPGVKFVEQQASAEASAVKSETDPILSTNSDHIADVDWDIMSILSKPIRLNVITWSTATPAFNNISNVDIYGQLTNTYGTSRITQLLKSFRFIRTGFRFRTQLTSTKFNAGKIKIIYIPPRKFDDTSAPVANEAINFTRAFSMPGVEMSAGGPGTTELTAPFSACMPYYSMQRSVNVPGQNIANTIDDYDWGTYNIWVLSPLRVPDGTCSDVTISIWMYLDKPIVSVPTRNSFNFISTQENEIDELKRKVAELEMKNNRMTVQSCFKIIPLVSNLFSSTKKGKIFNTTDSDIYIPANSRVRAEYMQDKFNIAITDVEDRMMVQGLLRKGMKRSFRFYRNLDMCAKKKMRVQSGASIKNTNDVYVHTRSLINSVADGPVTLGQMPTNISNTSLVTGGDSNDSILDLCQREGLLAYQTWNSSDPIDHVLFNFTVAPRPYFATPNHVTRNTPLGFTSLPFNYWRGGIRFRFSIVKTMFMQGRLQITYNPGNDTTLTDPQSELYTMTVDISETSDFTIECPYMYHKDWSRNINPSSGLIRDGAPGSIIVRAMNRLVTNDCATTVANIILYTSASDDFQVANLRAFTTADLMADSDRVVLLNLNSAFWSTILLNAGKAEENKKKRKDRMIVQSLLETTLPSTRFQASRPPIVMGVLNTPKLTDSTMNMDIFTSLSQVFSRPIRILDWLHTLGGPDFDVLQISMAPRLSSDSTPVIIPIYMDLVGYFSTLFRYWNGGFVFTASISSGDASIGDAANMEPFRVSYRYDQNFFVDIENDTSVNENTYYPSTTFNMLTRPLAAVHVPLVSQNSCMMSDFTWTTAPNGAARTAWAIQSNMMAGHVAFSTKFHEEWDVQIYRSAAPDFKYSFFVGVPAPTQLDAMFVEEMRGYCAGGRYSDIAFEFVKVKDISTLSTAAVAFCNLLGTFLTADYIVQLVTSYWGYALNSIDTNAYITLFGFTPLDLRKASHRALLSRPFSEGSCSENPGLSTCEGISMAVPGLP